MTARIPIAVAALVHDGKVLLVHRHPSRQWYPDCWDLVGGHIEPGERPEEAIVRECREELGVDIHDPASFAVAVSDPDLDLHAFLVTRWEGEPLNTAPEEHDALRWFRPDELGDLELADPAGLPGILSAVRGASDQGRARTGEGACPRRGGQVPEFTWLPANEATTEDVEAVFEAGGARKCRCQALKVPGWIWRDTTQEQRDAALLEQTACGTSGPTSGLVGYVDGEPAGWVAVEPRENYPRIWARQKSWMRTDPDLEGVWSVTCFVVRKGYRRQGLMYELAAATVEYGRQVGAHVLEGYPTEPPPGKTVIWDEASVGLLQVFLEAGYEVETSPTLRRRVVRHRLGAPSGGR